MVGYYQVYVVDGWICTSDSIQATTFNSYCLGFPLSVLPTELHQQVWDFTPSDVPVWMHPQAKATIFKK
jgi:hypothetical protein